MNHARLKNVSFFGSMSEQDLEALAGQTEELSVEAGTVLAREGDLGERVLRDRGGDGGGHPRRRTGPALGAGDFFGEIASCGRSAGSRP